MNNVSSSSPGRPCSNGIGRPEISANKAGAPCTCSACASSYGAGTKSSGIVKIVKDLDQSIEGRDVLVVEDIIDSGRTLSHLMKILNERKPSSICLCTLLDKPERREVDDVNVDYTGFQVPDEFVVGYGLDYDQMYRNLPYVGVVETE